MLTAQITRSSPVIRTARVMQMEGMFDVPAAQKNQQTWSVQLDLPEHWNIGLIVGPSGCGKTAIAEELFQRELVRGFKWDARKSLLDGFPAGMSIKDIVQLLSSVGFSSPPAWVRPFHVLSNGEQFRVTMARALAENKELAVVDEFTSVVDRTVAKIGSAAIAKTVRRREQKFIAITCHYDVAPWLAPDWIYQPHVNKFALARGSLQRPPIALEIRRVHSSAWELFQPHHYLSADLNRTAVCFCAFLDDQPVAFDAWLPFIGKLRGSEKGRRCHRIVTLPDFQGVSIGNALLAHDAGVWTALGYRAMISTGHPGFMHALARDQHWQMTASPRRTARDTGTQQCSHSLARSRSTDRLMASFRYTGPPADVALARQLMG